MRRISLFISYSSNLSQQTERAQTQVFFDLLLNLFCRHGKFFINQNKQIMKYNIINCILPVLLSGMKAKKKEKIQRGHGARGN